MTNNKPHGTVGLFIRIPVRLKEQLQEESDYLECTVTKFVITMLQSAVEQISAKHTTPKHEE